METEKPTTTTIATRDYQPGDRVLALIMRDDGHGTCLERGEVTMTHKSHGEPIHAITVTFTDGATREYRRAGLTDYVLKVVPA